MTKLSNSVCQVAVFLLLSGPFTVAWGEETLQSLESIRMATRTFLEHQVQTEDGARFRINVGRLDKRLRLERCPQDLETFLPLGGRLPGRTTVGVRCPTTPGWTIYVPAKVKKFGYVLVASRTLPRGMELTAKDVEARERELTPRGYAYVTDPGEAVGKILKRHVTAGEPLTYNNLNTPNLVFRGERVTLLAESAGIQVQMTGKAIADGRSGERVRVRNLNSQREVEGVVISRGVIKVTL